LEDLCRAPPGDGVLFQHVLRRKKKLEETMRENHRFLPLKYLKTGENNRRSFKIL